MRISATPNRIGGEPGQMTSSARVTIRDVAQHAGVSQPTASLVLGRHPRARVAPATRERVLASAAELGYRPNVVAQSLARGRSFALGVIVPDLRNPFFADVVAGAERVASAAGYALLLCGDGERPVEIHLETLLRRQIDGVILDAAERRVARPAGARGCERRARRRAVAPLAGRRQRRERRRTGGGRAPAGARAPAAGLHRSVGRSARLPHARARLRAGAARGRRPAAVALAAAGRRDRGRWARRDARPAGRAAASDAVFCANDLLAIGALKAAAEGGVRVPAELSLIGCDDIEMARL
jgi:LacI family transcriptional regulator